MPDLANLNLMRNGFHTGNDVVDEPFLCVRRQQTEKIAGLGEIVISVPMIVTIDSGSPNRPGRIAIARIFDRAAETIRLIIGASAAIFVEAYVSVAVIGVDRTPGLVDRQKVVVHAHAMAVGVGI